jgi:rhodanese-related sulfurtransferase/DNA-binding HxlR family transcriptional regulator
MVEQAAKTALFDEFARLAKALSSGRRAEIVDVLANGERSVDDLAFELDQSVANMSQHLQILRRAGLVTTRREGTFVYYRLADLDVLKFWRSLQEVAGKRIADVQRLAAAYVGDRDRLEAVTKEELARRIRRKDDLVVLDVRPVQEYESGHIAGAVSIPISELRRRLSELPKRKEIVAYCRGPYCAFAPEAVRYLTRKGYKARLLVEGMPDWASAGLPLERTES